MTSTSGDLLAGRYRLGERLGSGGMAQVFRAVDEELQRDVAVKVLAPHLLDDPDARERLRREARSAATLTHPNVVTLYDTIVDGEQQFLVMEFVDGPTLADRLTTGPLSEAEAIRIAEEVAAALEAAHEQDLVHCDIKPANLLLDQAGRVKVADFGIARAVDATQTTTGQVYGSVPYLAPERARGEQAGPSSDLYALGCVLHEMLTGRPPFVGSTPTDTLSQHIHAEAPVPSNLRTGVSPGLDAVVARLLAKEPVDRHPDAAALRRDLARLAAGQPPASATAVLPAAVPETTRVVTPAGRMPTDVTPAQPAPPSRRWLVVAVIGLIVLVAVVLALTNSAPSVDPVTEPSATATEGPTDEPTTAPPTEATTAPTSEPTQATLTVEDAVAQMRQQLASGRSEGLASDRGVTEVDKRLAEVLKKQAEDKPGDVVKEIRELRKTLDTLVREGDLDARLAEELDAAAADLVRIVDGS